MANFYEYSTPELVRLLGERFKEYRMCCNLTQKEVAEQSGIGLTTIHKFENGTAGNLSLSTFNPEAESYGQLIDTCRKLHLPESDCQEVFRRMVFNILANNTDDHNKNFSFIMNEDGSWRLSPAYDITYIIDNGGFLPNEDHCLYIRTKLRNITREDAIQFARDNGISKQRTHSARQWMIGTAIVTSPYLCFANSKNKYDETDKKDVAAIGPADSGWNNGTDACE